MNPARRHRVFRQGWANGVVIGLWSSMVNGATVSTVANVALSEGQDFFDGSATSLSGNADAVVTPVVKMSDRWSLFPTYHGYYRGSQQIQSFAGGGTLFRDATGQSVLVKSVHRWGPWKIKPSLGAGFEWLRESKDEDWGDGLFDYRRFSGGVEAEWAPSADFGGRWAYDYYAMAFPNYSSLESSQDNTLSRELRGEKVLNSKNHMGTAALWSVLPWGVRMDLTVYGTSRNYDDQPLVDDQGQLEGQKRRDRLMELSGSLSRGMKGPGDLRILGSLEGAFNTQTSNQNHYDPKIGKFTGRYCSYKESRVLPSMTALSKTGVWRTTVQASWERRDYDNRLSQNPDGSDRGDPLWVTTSLVRGSVSRVMSRRVSVMLNAAVGRSRSNTNYEAVFPYNYRMANYSVGMTYEY